MTNQTPSNATAPTALAQRLAKVLSEHAATNEARALLHERVTALVAAGAPIDGSVGRDAPAPPLVQVLCNNRPGGNDMVAHLLGLGADPSVRDHAGMSALHHACEMHDARNRDRTPAISALLSFGADPNAVTSEGRTPLMSAARHGQHEILERLLAAGAAPNTRARNGTTALMEAAEMGHIPAVLLLLEVGADPNLGRTWSGIPAPARTFTALMAAAQQDHATVARALLGAGADPNADTAMGDTALLLAAQSGNQDMVRLLVEHGADPLRPTIHGTTAEAAARARHHTDVADWLRPFRERQELRAVAEEPSPTGAAIRTAGPQDVTHDAPTGAPTIPRRSATLAARILRPTPSNRSRQVASMTQPTAPPAVALFTDGACLGNPGPGGWAALLRAPDGTERLVDGGEADTTNNRMELMGAIAALEALKRPCRVTLTTDSKYVIQGITEWAPQWRARGWRTAANKPVKNQDLWERLVAAAAPHQVAWTWVKGHNGHPENERVDQAANAQARRARGASVPSR